MIMIKYNREKRNMNKWGLFVNKIKRLFFLFGVTFLFVCAFCNNCVYANSSEYPVQGKIYENKGEGTFGPYISKDFRFRYGEGLGRFIIYGDINEKGEYEHEEAYGVNDNVSFSYVYEGEGNSDNKASWNIESSESKSMEGIELDKRVQNGVIIVQKSIDGKIWTHATKKKYDCFKKANTKDQVIYTTTDEEIMQGTYYRITVAYQMKKRAGVIEKWGPVPDEETYEHKSIMEQYIFYICTDKNYVSIVDIETKNLIGNNATAKKGFIIRKNNSFDEVRVTRNSESSKIAEDYDSFTAPGNYVITITTKLNKVYKYNITVKEGASNVSLSPTVYEFKKNTGFVGGSRVYDYTSFGISSLTSLGISQKSGFTTTKSTLNGYDAYGVNGDSVSIFIKLNHKAEEIGREWKVTEDTWGKKEKEKVEDVYVGAIGQGAVIIKTSKDGKNWVDVGKNKYSNGLYNTDFAKHYNPHEDVFIYTPDGNDILSGLYIKVYFAYQVEWDKNKTDCLEMYEFYLCSNELSSVTFPNLTIENTISYLNDNNDTSEIYKEAETLTDNSGTVTGFSIKKKNPTVKYTIKKDGKEVSIPINKEFTSTGKYEVTLVSAVGDSETVTIYVDCSDNKEAMKTYFGKGFIQGKRIYDEGEYPVYEAGQGLTAYNLENVGDSYLPIYGVLRNETTGKEIVFEPSRQARKGYILEAGKYTATFKTGVSSNGTKSGDVRVFMFNFSVIENGTAPGPIINRNSLLEFARSNVSDSYPIYYGVTYPSAKKGYVTLAFAEEEEAIKFAYAYEKGMVEIQDDGTYRYNASTTDGQKESFDSLFDLTDATNEVSERIVKKYYFNLNDEFTYMTLSDEYNNSKTLDDYRALKLNRSIIVFADQQKECLINMASNEDSLPVVSAKKYAYIQPGDNGETVYGENDFKFIKDKYGADSNSVVIKDKEGKEYNINYKEGVAAQLEKQECPSGVITITETTIYGDSVSYDAIYIKPNENTSTTTIKYYTNGMEKSLDISVLDDGKVIDADLFTIDCVNDNLDTYSLIVVNNGKKEWFYSADKVIKEIWSEAGEYTVSILNRLGYGYSFKVNVSDTDYSVISFVGDGTYDQKDLVVQFGQENVYLPQLTKYGFDFDGYVDQNGQTYTDKIDKIMFKSALMLTSCWTPKKVNLRFLMVDGTEMISENVDFNTVYVLPEYYVEEEYDFEGWSYCGDTVQGSKIKIDNENEMVFTPILINKKTGTEIDVVEQTKGNALRNVLIIMVLFILGGGYMVIQSKGMIFKDKRKGNTNEN